MNKKIDWPIMPLFWYCRGGVSDRDWIKVRMLNVPEDKRQEVADRYDHLFLSERGNVRKKANEFLHGVATEYRVKAHGKLKA